MQQIILNPKDVQAEPTDLFFLLLFPDRRSLLPAASPPCLLFLPFNSLLKCLILFALFLMSVEDLDAMINRML